MQARKLKLCFIVKVVEKSNQYTLKKYTKIGGFHKILALLSKHRYDMKDITCWL